MIREAEEMIPQIPSIIDRAERFQHIAKAWQRADDKESAKMLLKEAMTLLQAWSWDRTRDEVTGQVLQLAHALDPDFAATLTPLVDNPIAEHMLRLREAKRGSGPSICSESGCLANVGVTQLWYGQNHTSKGCWAMAPGNDWQ
jgi:hypothetical protein